MSPSRCGVFARVLLAAYVLASALLPLAHHDVLCHLKSSTHCTTCVVASTGRNCRLGSGASTASACAMPAAPSSSLPTAAPPPRSGHPPDDRPRLRLIRRFPKRSGPRVRVNAFAVQTGVLFPIRRYRWH